MVQAFDFEEGGRTFNCVVEPPRGSRTEAWWWFGVSGDGHRYAPFQAAAGDTESNVRSRIVTYYEQLVFRRSQPVQPRQHWARRAKPEAPAADAPSPAV